MDRFPTLTSVRLIPSAGDSAGGLSGGGADDRGVNGEAGSGGSGGDVVGVFEASGCSPLDIGMMVSSPSNPADVAK